jgi:RNA polymerase sigma factor (sigma-70 family)
MVHSAIWWPRRQPGRSQRISWSCRAWWPPLPTLEREVIMLRFFQELDQHEIAARVGYSQMHISRLQRRALARMRAQLVEP